jgi:hypothetical protein
MFGMELTTGPTETYKVLDQRQLASSVATIYTVAASTTTFVRSIMVVNNDTSVRTAQFFVSGTTAADAITPAFAIPAGGSAVYEDGGGWNVYDANGGLQVQQPNSSLRVASLASDAAANSTTTLAAISGLDLQLEVGLWQYQYFIRYQAAVVTTGVKFAVDHQGTVTVNTYNARYVDVSATAATGAPTQNGPATATAQVMAAFSARADNTTVGPTASVDAANSDMLMVIEGVLKVTVAGALRLMHASEVAAASTVMAGTSLVAIKVG